MPLPARTASSTMATRPRERNSRSVGEQASEEVLEQCPREFYVLGRRIDAVLTARRGREVTEFDLTGSTKARCSDVARRRAFKCPMLVTTGYFQQPTADSLR